MHEAVADLRHYLRERVWNNAELSDRERTLALYLLTGEQANEAGLYCLSLYRAGQKIGCSTEEAEAHLARTVQAQEWQWDGEARVLWITDWFRAFPPQQSDLPRLMEMVRQLPPTPLVAEWARRTGDLTPGVQEAFLYSVTAVLAPDAIVAGDLTVKPAKPPDVLTSWVFLLKGGGTWALEEWRYREYQKNYGESVDVDGELRKAMAWCRDHKARRKTATGMPGFLTRWLGSAAEHGKGKAVSEQIERRRMDPRGNAAALERFMRKIGAE